MKINVAYSCNEAYIPQTGISMISLFENNRDMEGICVYLVGKDVLKQSAVQLEKIAQQYNRQFQYIPFESICFNLNISATGRHIETVYTKLFLHRIKDINKIFYLDSDTIINGSLIELWSLDIDDYVFAEVETFTARSRKKLGLSENERFFNDGVALINLKKYRELDIEKQCMDFIAKHNGNPPVLSEGTINAVCKGLIYSLNPKYNLMSAVLFFSKRYMDFAYNRNYYTEEILIEAKKSPIVIHYLSAFYNRPWNKKCTHPLKEKYLFYKSISPWKHNILQNKYLSFRLRFIKLLYMCLSDKTFLLMQNFKK